MRVGVGVLVIALAGLALQTPGAEEVSAAPGDLPARQVAVGGDGHSCLLDIDGSLRCWGKNNQGQLGLGDTANRGDATNEMGRNLPRVALGTGRVAVSVGVGSSHTCVLFDDGKVACWGDGTLGQLGSGSNVDRGDGPNEMGDNLPYVDLGPDAVVTQLAVGDDRNCVILDGGSVKCWGANFLGALGLGDFQARGNDPNEMGSNLPTVSLGADAVAIQLAVGGDFVCALMDSGSVKCWGSNEQGQLARGDTVLAIGDGPNEMGSNLVAAQLGTGVTVQSISAAGYHWCSIDTESVVRCVGLNDSGQLGLGDTATRGRSPSTVGDNLPTVSLPAGRVPAAIYVGLLHTCVRFASGELACWGFGAALGQGSSAGRGDGPNEMGDALPLVNLGAGQQAVQVALSIHTCVVRDDTDVVCFGRGAEGQLGTGSGAFIGDGAGEMGDALVPAALPPANDDMSAATIVSGDRGRTVGLNASATQQPDEPRLSFFDRASVWFRWTAPSTSTVQFLTTGSTFPTDIGIYTGSTLSSLTEVAFVEAGGLVELDVDQGVEYLVMVASADASRGHVVLSWRPRPPSDDDVASARQISGVAGSTAIDTTDATEEVGEPKHAGYAPFRSVWLRWTAPRGGRVRMTTAADTFDTIIGIYTGTTIDDLELIGADDDSLTGLDSHLVFTASAGSEYSIVVSGAAFESGSTTLSWTTAALCDGKPTTVALEFGDGPTDVADVVLGTTAAETIDAGDGDDTVCAGGGVDTVRGGRGNDVLRGDDGADVLNGDAGRDTLEGGADGDRLSGGTDTDTIDGGSGRDTLDGGSGADRLDGGTDADRLNGGPDADRLNGGPGRDALDGGSGADRLDGGTQRDSCDGNTGRDTGTRCETRRRIP